MNDQRPPLPPATFEFLVFSLAAQAEMQMGLIDFGPGEENPPPDLELAKHSIDMLEVLREKTKGNLQPEEQRLLEDSLAGLRFRFVEAAKEEQPNLIVRDEPRIIIP